jgi:hypothetical protein
VKRLQILSAIGGVTVIAALLGLQRLRAYIGEDPRFCATCHRQSPEFALWSSGAHGGITCQNCHHATVDQGIAMLRAFMGGAAPVEHAPVEIGACASCHLAHDKGWVQVGASRGHRIHVIEKKIDCVKCHGAGVHSFEPAVASCRSCHGDHAVRAAGMQQLHCFACHDFLSVETSLRPTRRDCLRCHRAQGLHPSRFPEDAPMRFACAACHKPHAPPSAERVGCETCHREIVKAGLHRLPAHRDCTRCHRPHGWRSESADCLKCHQDAASHDGHLTCSSCHAWRGLSTAPTPPGGT